MIVKQDSNQKITNMNGMQISIQEYLNQANQNDAIESVIDFAQLEKLDFSNFSMSSEDGEVENTGVEGNISHNQGLRPNNLFGKFLKFLIPIRQNDERKFIQWE